MLCAARSNRALNHLLRSITIFSRRKFTELAEKITTATELEQNHKEEAIRLEIADRLLRLRKPRFSAQQVAALTKLQEDKVRNLVSWMEKKVAIKFKTDELSEFEVKNYFRSFGVLEEELFYERGNITKGFLTFRSSSTASKVASSRVRWVKKQKVICVLVDPSDDQFFDTLGMLDVCPKCGDEFHQSFKKTHPCNISDVFENKELKEQTTIVLELKNAEEVAFIQQELENYKDGAFIQQVGTIDKLSNVHIFFVEFTQPPIPQDFLDFLKWNHYTWNIFIPDTDPIEPPLEKESLYDDMPPIDETKIHPRDGEQLKLHEKISYILDKHPLGIYEDELQELFEKTFSPSERSDNNVFINKTEVEWQTMLLDNLYLYVKLCDTPGGKRVFYLRPKLPRKPPDSSNLSPELLYKRWHKDLEKFLNYQKGGMYLSQFPDRFYKAFGYLPQFHSLLSEFKKIGIWYATYSKCRNEGCSPTTDIFFRKSDKAEEFFIEPEPDPFEKSGRSFTLPVNAQEKVEKLLLAYPEGIPETRFEPLWKETFGTEFWTNDPVELSISLKHHFPDVSYKIHNGEKWYILKKETLKQKKSEVEHINLSSRHVESAFSPVSICFNDVLACFNRYGFLKSASISLNNSIASCRVEFRDYNSVKQMFKEEFLLMNDFEIKTESIEPKKRKNCIIHEGYGLHVFTTIKEKTTFQISSQDLIDTFEIYGPIEGVFMHLSWPRQWWCVVSFKNKDAAEKAVRKSEHKIKNQVTYCRFQGEKKNDRYIKLRNLAPWMRPTDLYDYFASEGKVVSVKIDYKDIAGEESLCKGYIEYDKVESKEKMLNRTRWTLEGHSFICFEDEINEAEKPTFEIMPVKRKKNQPTTKNILETLELLETL